MSVPKHLVDVKIEDYLSEKTKTTQGTKGKCMVCGVLVTWSREKLASHKRGSCKGIDKTVWLCKFPLKLPGFVSSRKFPFCF